MKTVVVGDIEMAYRDAGAGVPMLLVHGFPLDHTMWDPVVERLGGACRLIIPDLRGYGRTSLGEVDDAQGVGMQRYADDLAGLLDAIGVAEPVVLVGFSMGGYIGWRFLERHAERVRSLGLCDTRAGADTDDARATRLKMAKHVQQWGAEHVALAMQPKLFAPGSIESGHEAVARTSAVISATDPRAIAAAQRGMAARPDVTDRLPAIDLPAALIVGQHDQLSTPAEMRSMAEAMPRGELTIVPDAGHMAPVENPGPVADALAALIARGPR